MRQGRLCEGGAPRVKRTHVMPVPLCQSPSRRRNSTVARTWSAAQANRSDVALCIDASGEALYAYAGSCRRGRSVHEAVAP